jgi:asparagine synthase (glutamine-hydrolysing)
MCGIAGQMSFDRTVEREDVVSMTRAVVHRGPDDEGFYFTEPDTLPSVGLGHKRLSIIDLSSAGHQPMSNERKSIWIVFNGEIYNFLTLKKMLQRKGHQFRSTTDTEVIIRLYEEYGVNCLNYLRGMFAFALWDKDKQRLFVARDRVGKKPLYYAFLDSRFSFASEINALYNLSFIKRNLDYSALDLFLTFSYIPAPYTIFEDIRKLPPAHYLILERGEIKIKRYWKLSYGPKLQISFDEAKQTLLKKLREAVEIRLYSDVPLGCFLSGGVDSSLIAALMSGLSHKPVKTFSIGFTEKLFDETEYARMVAKKFRTDHREFIVKPNAIEVLPDLIQHYGEPFGDSSCVPTWYLSELTRQDVTVALNGDGGDELFAGYNWYTTATILYWIHRITPQIIMKSLSRFVDFHHPLPHFRKLARLLDLLVKTDASRFSDLRSLLNGRLKQCLYSDYFFDKLNIEAFSLIENAYEAVDFEDELDKMLGSDISTYLPDDLLVKVDRATMAHSLEARSPFLDHELMEFVARLPSSFKCKWKWGGKKYILKEAAKDLFPQDFLNRPKTGFSIPLAAWIRKDLSVYIFENLCKGPLSELNVFQMDTISLIYRYHQSEKKDYGDLIWNLLVLSLWAKSFL